MFKGLRKNMKLIMWALLVTFVLWGGGSVIRSGRKGPNYAGKVFKSSVSFQEYAQAWEACKSEALMRYGEKFHQVAEYLNLEQEAWNRIILLREAKRRKIKANDDEVIDRIKGMPIFQGKDDSFANDLYVRIVKYYFKSTPRDYEERVRQDLKISRLVDQVLADLELTEEQLREEYRRQHEKVKASYILVEPDDFLGQVETAHKELYEYYDSQKEQFKTPLRVNVEYIPIEFSLLQETSSIAQEQVNRYYEEHSEEFQQELESIQKDAASPDQAMEQIQKKIEERLSLQQAKGLAEELAYQVSDALIENPDLGAAARKFNLQLKETSPFAMDEQIPGLGWLYQFSMAAFNLKPGETSARPIETLKGFYILRLKEKIEPYIPSLEEAKEDVEKALLKKKSRELAKKKCEDYLLMIEEASSHPEQPAQGAAPSNLEELAGQLSLQTHTTEFFTQDGYIPQIGRAQEFADEAFGIQKGEISKVVETPKGFSILSTLERIPVDEKKYLQEKEDFKEKVLNQKRQEYFSEWFQGLKEKASLISYL